MSTVRTTLQQKRLPLLDLITRSALVNYCPHDRYGVALEHVNAQSAFHDLVSGKKAFGFLSQTSAQRETSTGWLQLFQTSYSDARLATRLLDTFHRARNASDHYGETVLFLSIGLLSAGRRDDAKRELRAPLFFVPVSLYREEIGAPIRVSATGEDPFLNPALRLVLYRDHGIELPQWNVYQADGIRRCMDQVASAISMKPGWRVEKHVACVDFFDVGTVLRYLDLDPDTQLKGVYDEHRMLRSLLCGRFEHSDELIDTDLSTDMLAEPGRLPHVLDANNEQLMVLYHAMNGADLVVEGPAGTGKTQTIANLVAAALSTNRRVLFVSNKIQALEDAYERLRGVGLAHLVLPLFGRRLQRQELSRELKATIPVADPGEQDVEFSVEMLTRIRNKLNIYCNSLHAPVRESGISPFEAFIRLSELAAATESVTFPPYDGQKFVDWTAAQFDAFIEEVAALQNQFARIGVAQRHPFWGSRKMAYDVALKPEIQQQCRLAGMALTAIRNSSSKLAHQMGIRAPSNSQDVIRLVRTASRALEAPDLHGVSVYNEKWESSMADLAVMLETGAKLAAIREEFEEDLVPEAWHQDVLSIRRSLVAHGSKRMRMLKGEYRKARDRLAELCRKSIPKNAEKQLRLVNGILEAQRLQSKLEQYENLARPLFGRKWRGLASKWDQLDVISTWLIQLHQDIASESVNPEILDYLVQFPDLERLRRDAERVAKEFNVFLESTRRLAKEVGMEEALGISKSSFGRMRFSSLLSLFAHWENHLDSLQDIVAFNHMAIRLKEKGMEDIVKIAVSWSGSSRYLTSCIKAALYEALLTVALKTRQPLSSFDAKIQNQTVDHFEKLDCELIAQMVKKVKQVQFKRFDTKRLPSRVIQALVHELEESPKRTLDELMTDAGADVQDVKPVFFMTPTTVAALLAQCSVQFDLVLFDEAGRLRVSDALGAVARASQVVAFGDSNQASPEGFFEHMHVENKRESYSELHDESFLDLMVQRGAIVHRLSWHFSPYPSPLMQWANRHIYDDRLLLLPHSIREEVLQSVHVHDVSQKSHNDIEERSPLVKELVDAYLEQIIQHPLQSAVILVQTMEELEAIEKELDRGQKDESSGVAPEAAIPVKTMFQAQGDRYDVVFVGLSFKKLINFENTARHVTSFSEEHVQRRLAVLASVVRERFHIFVDVTPQEMKRWAVETSGAGVWEHFFRSLHEGPFIPSQGDEGPAIYTSIASALSEKGYTTALHVGTAGVHVDVAVEHPEKKGHYLLGILGDGFQYNRERIVRDRDRLRPALLEQRGWQLYRLWSIEWFRNPQREIENICDRIRVLLDSEASHNLPSRSVDREQIKANGSYPSFEKME